VNFFVLKLYLLHLQHKFFQEEFGVPVRFVVEELVNLDMVETSCISCAAGCFWLSWT